MQKPWKDRNAVEETRSSNKGKELCGATLGCGDTWPFRIKLTTDHIRWDSLKISHSEALDEHILENIGEANRKALEAWIPIDLSIHDVDTGETYKVKLVKKESFWFEPTPFLDEGVTRKKKSSISSSSSSFFSKTMMEEVACYSLEKRRKEFAYSIEPFGYVAKKRSLSYGQEIGLRWSGGKAVDRLEFSVLYVPRLDLLNLRF